MDCSQVGLVQHSITDFSWWFSLSESPLHPWVHHLQFQVAMVHRPECRQELWFHSVQKVLAPLPLKGHQASLCHHVLHHFLTMRNKAIVRDSVARTRTGALGRTCYKLPSLINVHFAHQEHVYQYGLLCIRVQVYMYDILRIKLNSRFQDLLSQFLDSKVVFDYLF